MNWKKVITLTGIVVICAGMLVGCGRVTPRRLIKKAQDNAAKTQSVAGDIKADVGIGIEQSGISAVIDMNMDMKLEMSNDPAIYHMSGKMSIPMAGVAQDVELYGEANKNISTVYMDMGMGWQKKTEEMERGVFSGNSLDMSFLLNKDYELTMEEKTEDSKDLYVISTQIEGERLQKLMQQSLGVIDESMVPDINFSEASAKLVLKIYKDTKLPAAFEMITEGESQLGEESGTKIKLSKLNLIMTFDKYDSLEKVEIPQAALDAKEINDSQKFFGNSSKEQKPGNFF